MTNHTPIPGISGSTLKLIAVVTMLTDHAGATVIRAIWRHPAVSSVPERYTLWSHIYAASRDIGRIAFPIFCFLLVEGFLHTRNVRKYAERLLLFALISELPFDLALKGNWYYPAKQNVYFTLLIGLLVLIGLRYVAQYPWAPADPNARRGGATASGRSAVNPPPSYDPATGRPASGGPASGRPAFGRPASGEPAYTRSASRDPSTGRPSARAALLRLRHWLWLPILAAGMYLALWLDTDYNFKGVFLIAALYLTHSNRLYQCAGGAAAVAWELPAPIAFIPVLLYNGTRGLKMKYFFYWFYPVHLLVLHVLAQYAVPAVLG